MNNIINRVNKESNRIIMSLIIIFIFLGFYSDSIHDEIYKNITILDEISNDGKFRIVLKRKEYVKILEFLNYDKNNSIDVFLYSDRFEEGINYFSIDNLPKNVKKYSYKLDWSQEKSILTINNYKNSYRYIIILENA